MGALKISDHHVRSPLLNVNRACQTCHRWPEEELRGRVFEIQDRTFTLRNRAMDALVALDRPTSRPPQGRGAQRRGSGGGADAGTGAAQFLLDFIEAENSMGFHAGGEAARVIAIAIDELRLGQLAVRDAGAGR